MTKTTEQKSVEDEIRDTVRRLFWLAGQDFDNDMAAAGVTPPDDEAYNIINTLIQEAEQRGRASAKVDMKKILDEAYAQERVERYRKKILDEIQLRKNGGEDFPDLFEDWIMNDETDDLNYSEIHCFKYLNS